MKKLTAIFIIIVSVVSCLTACGGDDAGRIEKELLGTWQLSEKEGDYWFVVDYQFSKNGECTISGSFMGVSNSKYAGTYTIDTDKQYIIITNNKSSSGSPVKLTYQWINEELILKSDGVKLSKH